MSVPSLDTLYGVLDATWPAATQKTAGGFTIRDGQGGGKRASAATLADPLSGADIVAAEQAMAQLGQPALFMVRVGEDALDHALSARGYEIVDPVNLYLSPADTIATELPPRTIAIPSTEPLTIMAEIWETGGIGPARLEVMRRVSGAKTYLLSRSEDQPAGTAFVGMLEGVAMLHALEILPEHRRKGLGRWAMRRAAFWALEQGAPWVSVLCTQANAAANALYLSLGMQLKGTYHYRIKPE